MLNYTKFQCLNGIRGGSNRIASAPRKARYLKFQCLNGIRGGSNQAVRLWQVLACRVRFQCLNGIRGGSNLDDAGLDKPFDAG